METPPVKRRANKAKKTSKMNNIEFVVENENNAVEKEEEQEQEEIILDDRYTKDILRVRYENFRQAYLADEEHIKKGIPIRHQNTPEDITENITKFIIRKYKGDQSCVWCKGVDKSIGLTGDLYSNKCDKKMPIEVKSFTSNGPSQFGPDKKFSVLYFLDLRNWLNNEIVLFKVNLSHDSSDFKNIAVSKTQTLEDQLKEGRRPHISWERIHPQIKDKNCCEQIYKGTFENILE